MSHGDGPVWKNPERLDAADENYRIPSGVPARFARIPGIKMLSEEEMQHGRKEGLKLVRAE